DAFASASRKVYGQALRPRYHFDRAKVILSLDADFLGATDRDTISNTRGFAAGRRVDDGSEMNRLYAVESQYSITGGMADNRLRLRSSDIAAFVAALAGKFGIAVSGGEAFADHRYVNEIAVDLRRAGPNGVVLAGESQGEAVHALCIAINDILGAVGETVTYLEGNEESAYRISGLRDLIASMSAGRVDILFIIGANPVYDAPPDLGFADAMGAVRETIHLGLYVDETASASEWHLPRTHFLESWGDGRSYDGTMSVTQPLIAPLYEDARSELEIISLAATGTRTTGYDLVRQTWQGILGNNFEAAWPRVLHDGLLPDSGFSAVIPRLRTSALPSAVSTFDAGIELVLRLDNSLLDGSFANNAWLQELPDPTTKIVWDNAAIMNPATAESLGLGMDLTKGRHLVDRVTITVRGSSVDVPIWIQPGLADQTVALALGYGRTTLSNRPERRTNLFDLDDYTDVYGHGAISTGVGENVSVLRSSDSMSIVTGAEFVRSGGDYMVASTQDHGALPEEQDEVARRGIFRMATLEEFRADPHFVSEHEPKPIRESWAAYPTLWESDHPTGEDAYKDNDYYRNQWGMVIDLNTCTGCNACIVACQSENNIQVVGKQEVSLGREMHWLRLDRYYVSPDGLSRDDPHMVMQPMPCMHCENAPCEEVCPVSATVHSPDGTNQMVYNRCIGTRYCANNCPYKVRRFNYYNWTKTLPITIQMAQNPNVTVRSRGVMEKCSYCIQRIREVNKRANIEERAPEKGEVVTACQQVCPASAITFGDLNRADSEVTEKRKSTRRYELLAELGTKPRTSYLGRIRNPNPRLMSEA
ncbi:MAG: 4Fe-4S dicluster domain-containing protein, partial [Bacteroidetes bacterium]|nr:4Fe-4S dicluster domain-containing protein [Bacteroidota bacterium]